MWNNAVRTLYSCLLVCKLFCQLHLSTQCPLIRCPLWLSHVSAQLYKSLWLTQTQNDRAMAFLWILSCLAFAGATYGETNSLTSELELRETGMLASFYPNTLFRPQLHNSKLLQQAAVRAARTVNHHLKWFLFSRSNSNCVIIWFHNDSDSGCETLFSVLVTENSGSQTCEVSCCLCFLI